MINNKGIYIKNVYYMLTYAFRALRQQSYEKIASEDFENIQELFAEILSKGVSRQLKQGLYREYISFSEDLMVLRGKLNIYKTIKDKMIKKQQLNCEYDELSENNVFNQIIKTTLQILVKSSNVKVQYKAELKKILVFFKDVDTIEPICIHWNMLHYQRNNKDYELLMNMCYFVLDSLLLSADNGEYKLATFSDDLMAKVYEKFILEYYKRHHNYLSMSAMQVKWNLDKEQPTNSIIKFLPTMQTDITLRKDDRILIIDAKYYGKTMQTQYEKQTFHSHNMYQIFAYVKNQDVDNTGNVSGILLYAKTNEDITPNNDYSIGGNKIGVHTLDLNTNFDAIKEQLDNIAVQYVT